MGRLCQGECITTSPAGVTDYIPAEAQTRTGCQLFYWDAAGHAHVSRSLATLRQHNNIFLPWWFMWYSSGMLSFLNSTCLWYTDNNRLMRIKWTALNSSTLVSTFESTPIYLPPTILPSHTAPRLITVVFMPDFLCGSFLRGDSQTRKNLSLQDSHAALPFCPFSDGSKKGWPNTEGDKLLTGSSDASVIDPSSFWNLWEVISFPRQLWFKALTKIDPPGNETSCH